MVSKEFFSFCGTKDTSRWVVDPKNKVSMEIAEYVGRFCASDGSEFTVTEKSDKAFFVTTKKNQITGVFIEDTSSDGEEPIWVRFVGKMALAFRVASNYSHYKILFADVYANKVCHGLMFESCGYEAKEIPFKQVYGAFTLLADASENANEVTGNNHFINMQADESTVGDDEGSLES